MPPPPSIPRRSSPPHCISWLVSAARLWGCLKAPEVGVLRQVLEASLEMAAARPTPRPHTHAVGVVGV